MSDPVERLRKLPRQYREVVEAADKIERLQADRETYNRWAEEIKAGVAELKAEIERLRALVLEAAEILDGDGEYPETAKRFREALGIDQQSTPQEK